MNNDLKKQWANFVEPAHVDWTWRVLETLYGEPHRAYHNLTHIDACMDLLAEARRDGACEGTPVVELALFWHDAVYVPGDKRNEELSAGLLRSLVLVPWAVHSGHWDAACDAILATKNHETVASNEIARLTIDIDLAILGSESATYRKYVRDIRQEYATVSDEAWKVGRSGFLAKMLERARLFQTDWAHERFDSFARINMRQELETFAR
jgi:predicted metal-dependent HD superfamily phosphohydrolase